MKGDGKSRFLGFGLPISTYEFEEHLPSLIRIAFAAARKHDMAVMLQFDFHLQWTKRLDLWNWFDPNKPDYNPDNNYNVEWHGGDELPNKAHYLNWGGTRTPATEYVLDEFEKLVDQAIEMLGEPEKVPKVYRLK
jgi:hypothetical protein